MRRILGAAVLGLGMLAGARGAGAQLVDPSTGIMVNAATDPMDFLAVASGQPGNVVLEAAMSASAQAQAAANQSMAATQAATGSPMSAMDVLMSATMSAKDPAIDTPSPIYQLLVASRTTTQRLATTPKPVITPDGGTFKTGLQVTITERDSAAAVFYTTDGTRPTSSSRRYAGPIAVNAKTKVEALAFDVSLQPSGVVSKTFKVKAAKRS